jgi:CheY-like chemotaxis protein
MGASAVQSSPANRERGIVLVVEDEILIRMALAEVLRDEGFVVLEAADADEALNVLGSPQHVDVILTDVNMPGSHDGLALGRRARGARPHVKVIVVSGRGRPAAADDVADAFFAKPYDFAAMIDTLEGMIAPGAT